MEMKKTNELSRRDALKKMAAGGAAAAASVFWVDALRVGGRAARRALPRGGRGGDRTVDAEGAVRRSERHRRGAGRDHHPGDRHAGRHEGERQPVRRLCARQRDGRRSPEVPRQPRVARRPREGESRLHVRQSCSRARSLPLSRLSRRSRPARQAAISFARSSRSRSPATTRRRSRCVTRSATTGTCSSPSSRAASTRNTK